MTRIRGGPLLTHMLEDMKQKQWGRLMRNMSIYSAHDTTINFLMSALDVVDQVAVLVDYAATIALEMYCNTGEECIVNVSDFRV